MAASRATIINERTGTFSTEHPLGPWAPQGIEDMASSSNAERWRALTEEALAAATGVADRERARILWQIALGYRRLAQHAERRQNGRVARPAVSYGPEALTAICQAFDEAWRVLAVVAGNDPLEIETARLELATALLSVANEDSRDGKALRDAALQAIALSYPVVEEVEFSD